MFVVCLLYHTKHAKNTQGPRIDELNSTLEVGQTLHFRVQEFHFDKKTGKSSVFCPPSDTTAVIEPFSMIQVCS